LPTSLFPDGIGKRIETSFIAAAIGPPVYGPGGVLLPPGPEQPATNANSKEKTTELRASCDLDMGDLRDKVASAPTRATTVPG
jgi:hypothetical protein